MNKRQWMAIIGLISIALLPEVLAFSMGSLDQVLGDVGRTIYELLRNQWFRFGITFILFYMVMYAIYAAGINRVSAFKGKGALPNKPGKIVAGSLGLITAMGVAYWANYSAREFTERILSVAGWFGALSFAFLVFGVSYYNMKSDRGEPRWGFILFVTGLAMLTYATLIGREGPLAPAMSALGGTFIFFGLLFWILGAVGSDAANDGSRAANGVRNAYNQLPGRNGQNGQGGSNRPSRPTGFVASSDPQTGGANLNWNANPAGDNVTGYEIERRRKRAIGWRVEGTFNTDGGQVSYQDATPLNPNTRYQYRIRAVNNHGRSGWAESDIGAPSGVVDGYIYFSADGVQANFRPLQGIQVRLSGASAEGPVLTNNNGYFRFPTVPLNRGNHTLHVTDPHNVYSGRNIANVANLTQNRFTIQHLLLRPSGRINVNINANVFDHNTNNALPAGYNLNVTAIGGFGTQGPILLRTQANGLITFPNVPAGYLVTLLCQDPANRYNTGSNHNNQVHCRFNRLYALPTNIEMTPFGPHTVNTDVYNLIPQNPLPGITVSFTSHHLGQPEATGPTNNVGNYTAHINAGLYTVRAEDPTGQHVQAPLLLNYPVFQHNQQLGIRMIGNNPQPLNVAERYDGNGNIIGATIWFV